MRLKEIFLKICPKYKITLMEWEHDIDHIHLLISATPVTELSKFINAYKSASSRLIKKEFPVIKSKLWKEYFWSRSFLVLSVGEASIEVIKNIFKDKEEKMKIIKKAYKFRIYPTLEQIIFFSKNFGCVRKVHNLMLDDRKKDCKSIYILSK